MSRRCWHAQGSPLQVNEQRNKKTRCEPDPQHAARETGTARTQATAQRASLFNDGGVSWAEALPQWWQMRSRGTERTSPCGCVSPQDCAKAAQACDSPGDQLCEEPAAGGPKLSAVTWYLDEMPRGLGGCGLRV